jgi:NADP-dependent 3-hydroxy acid dehydrogenase YdfG
LAASRTIKRNTNTYLNLKVHCKVGKKNMNELFDLSGKVGIVTGGSGGIGKALAVGLAKHGADVVVTSRTLSKLEPVAAEIQSLGRKAMAIP